MEHNSLIYLGDGFGSRADNFPSLQLIILTQRSKRGKVTLDPNAN